VHQGSNCTTNLKSAVIERDAQAIRFNPQLLELCTHYHFEPRPVALARGNEKGRVERAIRYIRDNFFAARQWTDLDDLNAQADLWCDGVSSDRRCPEDPSISVRQDYEREQPLLLGLPQNPFPSEERCEVQVHKTPYARFDLNDYSVPHTHVHRTLTMMATLDSVRMLDGTDTIARHQRSWDKGQQVENEAHIQGLIQHKRAATQHRGQNRLRHAVPSVRPLLEQAAERDEPLSTLVRDLNRLLDEYGASELEVGCIEALERGVPHANAVRLSLQRRREEKNLPPALAVPLPNDKRALNVSVRPASLSSYDHLHTRAVEPGNSNPDTPDEEKESTND